MSSFAFEKNLLDLSISKQLKTALEEWRCDVKNKLCLSTYNERRCICGRILKYGRSGKNIKNKHFIIVGSNCAKKFLNSQNYISNPNDSMVGEPGIYKKILNFSEYSKECFLISIKNTNSIDTLYTEYQDYLDSEYHLNIIIERIKFLLDKENIDTIHEYLSKYPLLIKIILQSLIVKTDRVQFLIDIYTTYKSYFDDYLNCSLDDKMKEKRSQLKSLIEKADLESLEIIRNRYKQWFDEELQLLWDEKIKEKRRQLKSLIEKADNLDSLIDIHIWFDEELQLLRNNKIKVFINTQDFKSLVDIHTRYKSDFDHDLDRFLYEKMIEKADDLKSINYLTKYKLDEKLDLLWKKKWQSIQKLGITQRSKNDDPR